MWVRQAPRFELDPNQETRIALAKHVGAARFAYNWGLARCLEAKARGERIPARRRRAPPPPPSGEEAG